MTDYASEHRTRGEMQRMINSYLKEWHDRPICEITRGEIKELLRVKARTAPVMANRLLSLITKIFNWALKEELIESSPAMRIDRPGQETERERSLSAEEIRTAWTAFDKLGYPFGGLQDGFGDRPGARRDRWHEVGRDQCRRVEAAG